MGILMSAQLTECNERKLHARINPDGRHSGFLLTGYQESPSLCTQSLKIQRISWSERWESNPHNQLGKLVFCH
jgi:hypothetical protein